MARIDAFINCSSAPRLRAGTARLLLPSATTTKQLFITSCRTRWTTAWITRFVFEAVEHRSGRRSMSQDYSSSGAASAAARPAIQAVVRPSSARHLDGVVDPGPRSTRTSRRRRPRSAANPSATRRTRSPRRASRCRSRTRPIVGGDARLGPVGGDLRVGTHRVVDVPVVLHVVRVGAAVAPHVALDAPRRADVVVAADLADVLVPGSARSPAPRPPVPRAICFASGRSTMMSGRTGIVAPNASTGTGSCSRGLEGIAGRTHQS